MSDRLFSLLELGSHSEFSKQAAPAERRFPPRDLPGAVPFSGEREWGDRLLHTEAMVREGSELMDHREVRVESSEDAAGA